MEALPPVPSDDVTALLRAWGRGDAQAGEKLAGLVYAELRRTAARHLRRERREHSLAPTALVHEAYLRLAGQRRAVWKNRAQFYAVAARTMRRILVDHARQRRAAKRGGSWLRISLAETVARGGPPDLDLLALDEASRSFRGDRCREGSHGRAALFRRPDARGNRQGDGRVGCHSDSRVADGTGLALSTAARMTPERWRQVETLFQAALRRPPEERNAFLDAECVAEPGLKDEVVSLLKADARAGSFLEAPAAAIPPAANERGPAPGDRLGPYEIVGRLGAGGMGEVYRARDPRLGREVAIKVLTPGRAQDKDARARFEREAKTASALNHPHIVNIYEIGEAETLAGPTYYIAMELVEGQTLRERLKGGAGWRNLVGPLAQVADALAKAHKAGIVHRDLKPENIMLTPDGYPKVLDFGLAKLMEAGEAASAPESAPTRSFEGHTRAGTILGTPGYMSPEQVQGEPLDSRSDIFSLGCILYEAAAGRRPFRATPSWRRCTPSSTTSLRPSRRSASRRRSWAAWFGSAWRRTPTNATRRSRTSPTICGSWVATRRRPWRPAFPRGPVGTPGRGG
jgi:RNA polymerase sigma factor (TIGR02999 family)